MDIGKEIDAFFKRIISVKADFDLYKEILNYTDNKKFKYNYSFFATILDSLRFSFIIKTIKLIDIREEKNIYKFLNFCEQNENKFLKTLNIDYINDETSEVETIIIKEVNVKQDIKEFKFKLDEYKGKIENLKFLRDKIYAHTDKEYFYDNPKLLKNNTIKYCEIEKILTILYENLNAISVDYNQKCYMPFPPFKNELNNLLKSKKD